MGFSWFLLASDPGNSEEDYEQKNRRSGNWRVSFQVLTFLLLTGSRLSLTVLILVTALAIHCEFYLGRTYMLHFYHLTSAVDVDIRPDPFTSALHVWKCMQRDSLPSWAMSSGQGCRISEAPSAWRPALLWSSVLLVSYLPSPVSSRIIHSIS